MSDVISPDVEIVTAPVVEVSDQDTQQSESTNPALENSETHKDTITDQSDGTTSDDGSENDDTESEAKKKPGFQRRIERAKAQATAAAQAEIEYWKKAAMSGKVPDAPATQTQVANDKPKLADYADIESYTEAVTDWKIEHRFSKETAAAKQNNVQKAYADRAAEFTKKNPDFSEVIQSFINDYQGVDIPELMTVAADGENGPALAYHLAKNPDDMERILALPSHRRLIELGKLEDRLSTRVVPVKKVSSAPAPLTTDKGAAVGKKDINDPKLSQAEYRQARMEQRKGKF
jgi:hypothetical protein